MDEFNRGFKCARKMCELYGRKNVKKLFKYGFCGKGSAAYAQGFFVYLSGRDA